MTKLPYSRIETTGANAITGERLFLDSAYNKTIKVAIEEAALSGSGGNTDIGVEFRTITGGEETAKELTLAETPLHANKVVVMFSGGTTQYYGDDYTVSGDVLSWSGTPMESLVTNGSKLVIVYPKSSAQSGQAGAISLSGVELTKVKMFATDGSSTVGSNKYVDLDFIPKAKELVRVYVIGGTAQANSVFALPNEDFEIIVDGQNEEKRLSWAGKGMDAAIASVGTRVLVVYTVATTLNFTVNPGNILLSGGYTGNLTGAGTLDAALTMIDNFTLGGGGGGPVAASSVTTTGFSNNLLGKTDVQAALSHLDGMNLSGGGGGGAIPYVEYFKTDNSGNEVNGDKFVDLAHTPTNADTVKVFIAGGTYQLNESLTVSGDYEVIQGNRVSWAGKGLESTLDEPGLDIIVEYYTNIPSPALASNINVVGLSGSLGTANNVQDALDLIDAGGIGGGGAVPFIEYFETDGQGTVGGNDYVTLNHTPSDPASVSVRIIGGAYQKNEALETPGDYIVNGDQISWAGRDMAADLNSAGLLIAIEYFVNIATVTQASDIQTNAFSGSLASANDVQDALDLIDSVSLGGAVPKIQYFTTDASGSTNEVNGEKYVDLDHVPSDPEAVSVRIVSGAYQINQAIEANDADFEVIQDAFGVLKRVSWDSLGMESALNTHELTFAVEYFINSSTLTQASDIQTTLTGPLSAATDVQTALQMISTFMSAPPILIP